jgi:hypothetical protein
VQRVVPRHAAAKATARKHASIDSDSRSQLHPLQVTDRGSMEITATGVRLAATRKAKDVFAQVGS